jgi:hypothetical protein
MVIKKTKNILRKTNTIHNKKRTMIKKNKRTRKQLNNYVLLKGGSRGYSMGKRGSRGSSVSSVSSVRSNSGASYGFGVRSRPGPSTGTSSVKTRSSVRGNPNPTKPNKKEERKATKREKKTAEEERKTAEREEQYKSKPLNTFMYDLLLKEAQRKNPQILENITKIQTSTKDKYKLYETIINTLKKSMPKQSKYNLELLTQFFTFGQTQQEKTEQPLFPKTNFAGLAGLGEKTPHTTSVTADKEGPYGTYTPDTMPVNLPPLGRTPEEEQTQALIKTLEAVHLQNPKQYKTNYKNIALPEVPIPRIKAMRELEMESKENIRNNINFVHNLEAKKKIWEGRNLPNYFLQPPQAIIELGQLKAPTAEENLITDKQHAQAFAKQFKNSRRSRRSSIGSFNSPPISLESLYGEGLARVVFGDNGRQIQKPEPEPSYSLASSKQEGPNDTKALGSPIYENLPVIYEPKPEPAYDTPARVIPEPAYDTPAHVIKKDEADYDNFEELFKGFSNNPQSIQEESASRRSRRSSSSHKSRRPNSSRNTNIGSSTNSAGYEIPIPTKSSIKSSSDHVERVEAGATRYESVVDEKNQYAVANHVVKNENPYKIAEGFEGFNPESPYAKFGSSYTV